MHVSGDNLDTSRGVELCSDRRIMSGAAHVWAMNVISEHVGALLSL